MKKTLFILLIISFVLHSCNEKPKEKWKLVWEDDFAQIDGFDTTKWSKIPRGTSDWNKFMTNYDSCYAMRDGNLVLRGIQNTTQKEDTVTCLTGGVWTKDKVNFIDGRIEIRAKLDEATGAWPAIWMLAEDKQWPAGGEIDILEHLNFDSIVYQTIHTSYTLATKIKNPPNYSTNKLNRNDYNIYALELHKDSLVMFANDIHTITYPRVDSLGAEQFPFQDPFYLLIDMQLGGSWVGKVNVDELPVEMMIDWVRFYKKNE